MVALAAEHGRTVLCTWAEFAATMPVQTGNALAASTGVGAVPFDAPSTRFALARRFTLEQVDRVSVLHRPSHQQATPAGPDDVFETVSWDGHCPDGLIDAYATLRARMSTAGPVVFQGDTLVLPDYRGHGLGRRMKDHNLSLIHI